MENKYIGIATIMLIFLVNYSLCGCNCPDGQMFDGYLCKPINDGKQSCSKKSDCYDILYGDCVDGKCVCIDGYVFIKINPVFGRLETVGCLPNLDRNFPCKRDFDCKERNSHCYLGKCECGPVASYSLSSNLCRSVLKIGNNGVYTCSSSTECHDSIRGDCLGTTTKYCVCKGTYAWSEVFWKCGYPNDNSKACLSKDECLDVINGDCLNGVCACKNDEFQWGKIVGQYYGCIKKANGLSFCTHNYDCGTDNLCINGKCTCRAGYRWNSLSESCKGPENYNWGNGYSCTTKYDCADYVNGDCVSNNCVCNAGYVFRLSKYKCIKTSYPNAKCTCSKDSDCFNYIPGVCISGYCSCPTYTSFDMNAEKCLVKNNGYYACVSKNDCQPNGSCLNGKCVCKSGIGSLCSKSKVGENCNTVFDCADSANMKCSAGKCSCKTGYTSCNAYCTKLYDGVDTCYSSRDCSIGCSYGACVDNKCIKFYGLSPLCECKPPLDNQGSRKCIDTKECYDQENGLCDTGYCKCITGRKFDYKYSNKCLVENNNGVCNVNEDCVDSYNGGCIGGQCKCNTGFSYAQYMYCESTVKPNIQTYYSYPYTCIDTVNGFKCSYCICTIGRTFNTDLNKCLIRNNGLMPASSLADCYDQQNGLYDGTCKCKDGYLWNEQAVRCGLPNNAQNDCTTNLECMDYENGGCFQGKCICFGGIWDEFQMKCNIDHIYRNGVACFKASQCVDAINGICDGTCKCKEGFYRLNPLKKCTKKNDGFQYCADKSDCCDSSSLGGCINGKCACKPEAAFTTDSLSCLLISDDTQYCTSPTECASKTCLRGKCTCPIGTSWNSIAKNCTGLLPNDGKSSCVDAAQCADNINGDCISNFCDCNSGYTWMGKLLVCRMPNDGTHSCKTALDCADDNDGDCLIGTCKCNPGYFWSSTQQKCMWIVGYYCQEINGIPDCVKCHKFCTKCHGTENTDCENCDGNFLDTEYSSTEGCQCKLGYYDDPNEFLVDKVCKPCHKFCTRCHGPTNSDCKNCDGNPYNTEYTIATGCQCKLRFFEDLQEAEMNLICKPCHKFCTKCHGIKKTDCENCDDNPVNTEYSVTNGCQCKALGFFEDFEESVVNLICKPCFDLCTKCYQKFDNCSACAEIPEVFLYGNTCRCKDRYFDIFDNDEGHKICKPCHPLCTICYGPTNKECKTCDEQKDVLSIIESSCLCKPRKYYSEISQDCQPCNYLCSECNGPTNNECKSCDLAVAFKVEDTDSKCVSECETRYYLDKSVSTCNSIFFKSFK